MRVEPGPGRESVWDHTRPPALDLTDERLVPRLDGTVAADTRRAGRGRRALAFYPRLVDCSGKGEVASPNEGGFYGGWVTSRVVGPVKGARGTQGW